MHFWDRDTRLLSSEGRRSGITRRRLMLAMGGGTALGLLSGAGYCRAGQDVSAPDTSMIAKLSGVLDAVQFGVTMSGRTDDSDALQKAIDAAHAARKMLLIPGGTALLHKPLRLQGRAVRLLGMGMDRTILRAGKAMKVLVDVCETQDKIVSPFEMEGLWLDGAGLAETTLAMRYRHHSVLRDLLCTDAHTGIDETDCWLARHYNCRVERHRTGWAVTRNGHSSLWESCSFVGCEDVHLAIDTKAAGEPSSALLFRGCDVEFGKGAGVRIGQGAVVAFDSCYIGENIGGPVFDNAGLTTVTGGVMFFGHTPETGLVRPTAGTIRLHALRISGQDHGSLSTLVAAPGGAGTVDIRGITPAFPIAGDPTVPGRPMAEGTVANLVQAKGRDWHDFGRDCTIERTTDVATGMVLRCCAARAGARFGASSALSPAQKVASRPVSAIIVYASSVPLTLRATGVPGSNPALSQTLGILPTTTGERTYFKLDEHLDDRPFAQIEIGGPASAGAWIALKSVTFLFRSDAPDTPLDLIVAK